MRNRLRDTRERLGLSAAELAAASGVTRQTVHAIEAGGFVPNTAVALKMARRLGCTVEQLFGEEPEQRIATPELLMPVEEGQPVRVAQVGRRLVAAPASAFCWPEADGVASPKGVSLRHEELLTRRIVVAGCDPAIAIVARYLASHSPFELIPVSCSSTRALELLRGGKVHVAGTHLGNVVGGALRAITLASWEEGIVVAGGNPKQIRGVADLARRGISIVNREEGAGSRILLDRELAAAGVNPKQISGYGRFAAGHLQAASFVSAGVVDACIAPFAAARAFGLGFVGLAAERYDLVISKRELAGEAAQTLFSALQASAVRRELSGVAGYDTALTGSTAV